MLICWFLISCPNRCHYHFSKGSEAVAFPAKALHQPGWWSPTPAAGFMPLEMTLLPHLPCPAHFSALWAQGWVGRPNTAHLCACGSSGRQVSSGHSGTCNPPWACCKARHCSEGGIFCHQPTSKVTLLAWIMLSSRHRAPHVTHLKNSNKKGCQATALKMCFSNHAERYNLFLTCSWAERNTWLGNGCGWVLRWENQRFQHSYESVILFHWMGTPINWTKSYLGVSGVAVSMEYSFQIFAASHFQSSFLDCR